MQKLGLIAGNRTYPLLFAKEAKKKGVHLVAVAFKGETSRLLKRYVDEIYWVEVGKLEELMDIFKSKDITSAVMVGQVTPTKLFGRNKLDKIATKILANVGQISAETIFSRIADELEKEGIFLKDARLFLEKYLATQGHINSLHVNDLEMQDIDFGKEIAKRIAGYNIGQTIVVKNRTVLSVEAIEGTDNTIWRGGRIGRGNVTVVKVSKPNQDMRFDVPVIGPRTVKILKRAGGGVLALESGQVLLLEKEKTVRLADKYGVKIIGI